MPRTRSILWSELKLGVIGIVATGLVVVAILAVGGQGGFPWQRYPLKTRFPAVDGLKSGAVVRLSGKDVGQITSVEFSGHEVEVVFEVSKSVRPLITTASAASIGSLGLLGDPILDITAAPEGASLGDWGLLPTGRRGGVGGVASAAEEGLTSLNSLVTDMRNGRGTIGKLATDDALYNELRGVAASAGRVSAAIEHGRGTLGALTTDRKAYESLRASLDNLQVLTTRVANGEGTVGRLLRDQAMADSLSKTAANLAMATDQLTKAQGSAGKFLHDDRVYEQLAGVSSRLDQLVRDLNAGEGTAGQLLHNRGLYDNMNSTVTEMKSLIADIRKDPKKFLTVKVSLF